MTTAPRPKEPDMTDLTPETRAEWREDAAATPANVEEHRHLSTRSEHCDACRILALLDALARVEALAEKWRYKGEFGWGAWQEGHGPDQEGYVLDNAARRLRAALRGPSDTEGQA